MMFKQGITIFGRHWTFLLRSVPERTKLHFGMGNRCRDGMYVLFLDYDTTPKEWVVAEIELLHQLYAGLLGAAYLFQTKHGFHVVFLQKHTLGMIVDMMNCTSMDKSYKTIPLQYAHRVWILRQSKKEEEKIVYLGVYPSLYSCAVQRSNAHGTYLAAYMGVPQLDFMFDGENIDTEQLLTMGYYRIAERNN